MLAMIIIFFLLGAAFALFGYFIRFRGKYSLINGFEADFTQVRKAEAYTKRIGTIAFVAGVTLLVVGAVLCLTSSADRHREAPLYNYGVFLGLSGGEEDRMEKYSLVVIEPSEFSAKQVEKLHAAGKTVYGYLNIGSIEEYRPYYIRFQDLTLGIYEDWPDERWIDAASSSWQRFVVDELGKQYAEMGFDGLFLDNADVYYHYPTDDMFHGLCAILQGLKRYDLPLIMNGGDTFVLRCMEESTALALFDGINQETVFTSIDFTNHTYGQQPEFETTYFQEYLSKAKEYGLAVYLLEYKADCALSKRIDAYCEENGFLWYNADSLELC